MLVPEAVPKRITIKVSVVLGTCKSTQPSLKCDLTGKTRHLKLPRLPPNSERCREAEKLEDVMKTIAYNA